MKTILIALLLSATGCAAVSKQTAHHIQNAAVQPETAEQQEVARLEAVLSRLRDCQIDPMMSGTEMCKRAYEQYVAFAEDGKKPQCADRLYAQRQ